MSQPYSILELNSALSDATNQLRFLAAMLLHSTEGVSLDDVQTWGLGTTLDRIAGAIERAEAEYRAALHAEKSEPNSVQ